MDNYQRNKAQVYLFLNFLFLILCYTSSIQNWEYHESLLLLNIVYTTGFFLLLRSNIQSERNLFFAALFFKVFQIGLVISFFYCNQYKFDEILLFYYSIDNIILSQYKKTLDVFSNLTLLGLTIIRIITKKYSYSDSCIICSVCSLFVITNLSEFKFNLQQKHYNEEQKDNEKQNVDELIQNDAQQSESLKQVEDNIFVHKNQSSDSFELSSKNIQINQQKKGENRKYKKNNQLNQSSLRQSITSIEQIMQIKSLSRRSNYQQSSSRNKRYITEKQWRMRINNIPVGIVMMNIQNFEITFSNVTFNQISEQNKLNASKVFDLLKFKLIDQKKHQRKNINSKSSIFYNQINGFSKNLIEDNISKSKYNNRSLKRKSSELSRYLQGNPLEEIPYVGQNLRFILHNLNELNELYADDNNVIETYSQNINCKIVHSHNDDELLLIFQDFAKQQELQQVEEQNQFKTRVINTFSHELRTPLNGATLFLQASLINQDPYNEIIQHFILPALSCLKRQQFLINDIIDFSQINANELKLDYEDINLKEIFLEISQIFRFEFTKKGLGLAFDLDENVPTIIRTDKQRLLQIIVNIIQNALKFTDKGYVLVNLSVDQDEQQLISITIRDEGVGIKTEDLIRIQNILSNSTDNDKEWHGFGLVISQMLIRQLSVESHDHLIIDSQGYMKGTQIQFYVLNHLKDQDTQIHRHQRQTRFNSAPNLSQLFGLNITIQAKTLSKLIFQQLASNQNSGNNTSQLSFFEETIKCKLSANKLITSDLIAKLDEIIWRIRKKVQGLSELQA